MILFRLGTTGGAMSSMSTRSSNTLFLGVLTSVVLSVTACAGGSNGTGASNATQPAKTSPSVQTSSSVPTITSEFETVDGFAAAPSWKIEHGPVWIGPNNMLVWLDGKLALVDGENKMIWTASSTNQVDETGSEITTYVTGSTIYTARVEEVRGTGVTKDTRAHIIDLLRLSDGTLIKTLKFPDPPDAVVTFNGGTVNYLGKKPSVGITPDGRLTHGGEFVLGNQVISGLTLKSNLGTDVPGFGVQGSWDSNAVHPRNAAINSEGVKSFDPVGKYIFAIWSMGQENGITGSEGNVADGLVDPVAGKLVWQDSTCPTFQEPMKSPGRSANNRFIFTSTLVLDTQTKKHRCLNETDTTKQLRVSAITDDGVTYAATPEGDLVTFDAKRPKEPPTVLGGKGELPRAFMGNMGLFWGYTDGDPISTFGYRIQ